MLAQSGQTLELSQPAFLERLSRELAEAAQEDLHPSQLREVVTGLARIRNQVNAMEAAAVAALDRTGQWEIDGSRSLRSWLEAATDSSPQSASERISVARVMNELPETAAVFLAGDTTSEHMSALSRAAGRSSYRREALPKADGIFSTLSSRVRPGKFRQAVDAWAHRVDAFSVAEEYVDKAADAYLHVSTTIYGMVAVEGMLDMETGMAFVEALNATSESLFRARGPGFAASSREATCRGLNDPEAATAPSDPGTASADFRSGNRPVGRPRSSAANVASLRELLRLALTNPQMPNGTGGVPVHLVVTASIETLRADLDDAGVEPATMNGKVSLSAATARRLACDCAILPVVMNSKSQVLDVGRRTRLISPQLRLAIGLRDSHCRFPDCEAPIQDIHHIVFWANGGRTDRENLVGICLAHHQAVHERRYHLRGNANFKLEVLRT